MKSTIALARSAIIAALYFTLTYFLQPISFGPLQFRVAEMLTVLPIFMPEAIAGLTLGCALANLLSPFGWYDILFGTLATFAASVATRLLWSRLKSGEKAKLALCLLPPVVFNAIALPLVWLVFASDIAFFINMGTIALSQVGAVYFLGIPLYYAIKNAKFISK